MGDGGRVRLFFMTPARPPSIVADLQSHNYNNNTNIQFVMSGDYPEIAAIAIDELFCRLIQDGVHYQTATDQIRQMFGQFTTAVVSGVSVSVIARQSPVNSVITCRTIRGPCSASPSTSAGTWTRTGLSGPCATSVK